MIIVTTDGIIEVWADKNTSLERVVVASKSLETLEGITISLNLAGVSEDTPGTTKFTEIKYDTVEKVYLMHVDQTTFNIWFAFEVNSYLKYGKGEFEETIMHYNPEHEALVRTIKGLMYEN